MHCTKCGEPINAHHNYCSHCGCKIKTPLEMLRLAERQEQREFRKWSEDSGVYFYKHLADLCWLMANRKYHPNENKYRIDSKEIPASVFMEIKTTRQMAELLFRLLLPTILWFQQ